MVHEVGADIVLPEFPCIVDLTLQRPLVVAAGGDRTLKVCRALGADGVGCPCVGSVVVERDAVRINLVICRNMVAVCCGVGVVVERDQRLG